MTPKVSILVPHYQTPTLTRLCLRLLRMKTRRRDYEIIVIDNGSRDDSGDSLRKIGWVKLLRREVMPGERPARSHGLALNMGVNHASADRIVIMHTDTMVLREDWLDYLLDTMHSHGPSCGIVGSWKMESPRPWQRFGKWLEETCRGWKAPRPRPARYARSHCALYRRAAIACRPEMFDPSEGRAAGEELHAAAEAGGFHGCLLPPEELCRYVRHLNHATMALNTHFGETDRYMPRTRARAMRRIHEFFRRIHADEILANHALDS